MRAPPGFFVAFSRWGLAFLALCTSCDWVAPLFLALLYGYGFGGVWVKVVGMSLPFVWWSWYGGVAICLGREEGG